MASHGISRIRPGHASALPLSAGSITENAASKVMLTVPTVKKWK